MLIYLTVREVWISYSDVYFILKSNNFNVQLTVPRLKVLETMERSRSLCTKAQIRMPAATKI
jgi:hypothetical protein